MGVGGRVVAGALSAAGLVAAVLSLALVLAVPAGTAGATSSKVIKVSTAKVPKVGTVLTTSSGLTLYHFTDDPMGSATCTGACAKIWPPLLAAKGSHVSGPHGVKGLSLINVGSGHYQVAFHDVALYRYAGDKKKGQAHGQDVGKVWFAVLKSGIPATTAAGAPAATSTTAPGASTTQPVTSTTQGSHSNSSTAPTTPPPAPMQTPATQTPVTQTPATSPPPTSPPTTPPTSPPTTPTTTAAPPSGGAGF